MDIEEIKVLLKNVEHGDEILEYIEEQDDRIYELESDIEECYSNESGVDDGDWEEIYPDFEINISVADWEKYLKDENIFDRNALTVLKRMRHVAAPTAAEELSQMFGNTSDFYSDVIKNVSKTLLEKINNSEIVKDNSWQIMLVGLQSPFSYKKRLYSLRPELYEAIGNVDLSNIPLR